MTLVYRNLFIPVYLVMRSLSLSIVVIPDAYINYLSLLTPNSSVAHLVYHWSSPRNVW